MAVFSNGKKAFDYICENKIDEYTNMLYRVAIHNTGNEQDAEDAVQDTFLKLIKNQNSFKDEEHLKAWLIRVLINTSRDLFKKKSHEVISDETVPEESYTEELGENTVLEAVLQLPASYKNAIYLYYYEEHSVKEIAVILDEKENTVLSWLFRGRELLKKTIGGIEQ